MGEIRDLAISFLDWLPLDRAAKHLSTALDQELTEVDLLGLARQKLLTLSVYFPNLAKAKYGEVFPYPRSELEAAVASGSLPMELDWILLSPEEALALPGLPREAEGKYVLVIRNLKIDEDHYVRFPGKVRTIEGVWDLPMIGGEKIGVEKELQRLTGRSPITCQALEGVIVRGIDGTLCQLQEQFHFNEYSAAWNEERRQLKQQIANEEIELEEGQRLLDMHKEERNQYLKMVKQVDSSECYYPARNFPQDSYLVIRREALAKFQELARDPELKSRSQKTGGGQHDSHQNPCKPVCAEQIIRHFKVKADAEENAEWWRNKMRNALDYGLAEYRVGGGRPGRGGSLWRPDCIAGWLIVSFKTYTTTDVEGLALWEKINERLGRVMAPEIPEGSKRFGEPYLIRPRLGQGAFRVLVTDIYRRRCAITQERTLPALEAAHIRPYGDGGAHEATNGLLLRRDIHSLFDAGYVTVTPELRFEVSRRIREEFDNGKHYYDLHGHQIQLPSEIGQHPNPDALRWHNENCFKG